MHKKFMFIVISKKDQELLQFPERKDVTELKKELIQNGYPEDIEIFYLFDSEISEIEKKIRSNFDYTFKLLKNNIVTCNHIPYKDDIVISLQTAKCLDHLMPDYFCDSKKVWDMCLSESGAYYDKPFIRDRERDEFYCLVAPNIIELQKVASILFDMNKIDTESLTKLNDSKSIDEYATILLNEYQKSYQ